MQGLEIFNATLWSTEKLLKETLTIVQERNLKVFSSANAKRYRYFLRIIVPGNRPARTLDRHCGINIGKSGGNYHFVFCHCYQGDTIAVRVLDKCLAAPIVDTPFFGIRYLPRLDTMSLRPRCRHNKWSATTNLTSTEPCRIKPVDMVGGAMINRQSQRLIEITIIKTAVPGDGQHGPAHNVSSRVRY